MIDEKINIGTCIKIEREAAGAVSRLVVTITGYPDRFVYGMIDALRKLESSQHEDGADRPAQRDVAPDADIEVGTLTDADYMACASREALAEAVTASCKWPGYNSAHEALGVLLEEVHEFELEVFARQGERDADKMYREAIQVAAVAIRTAAAIRRDRNWIRK